MRDLARGGEAVLDTERGIVLAAGALPGEKVRLGDVGRDGGTLRGEVQRVLVSAPERVEPACARVARCGGCPWMIATLDAQQAWKQRFVAEAVGDAAVQVALVATGEPLGYRRRARLVFQAGRAAGGKDARLGYRARRAHTVVDAPDCVVLAAPLAAALASVRELLLKALAGEGEVYLAASLHGDAPGAVVVLTSESVQPPAVFTACAALAALPGIAGVALQAGGASAPAVWGEPRERMLGSDGLPLIGTVHGFSQAHAGVNDALVAHVVRLAEPAGQRVLELYAGHGNLTVALAPGAASLVAVENDAAAAAACRENVVARGLRDVRVVAGDAAAYEGGAVDVVVLDPPRTGARDVLASIAGRKPARIVYVSCDTATLGRDVKALRALGYAPDAAVALDMFPQTAHVEAVVRFAPTPARPRPGAGASGKG